GRPRVRLPVAIPHPGLVRRRLPPVPGGDAGQHALRPRCGLCGGAAGTECLMPLDQLSLELRADRAELARLHAAVDQFAPAHRRPVALHDDVQLALEECALNVIDYAFRTGAGHTFAVRLAWTGDEVIAELEDAGTPFNPLALPPPDLNLPLEEMPVGGLGIH